MDNRKTLSLLPKSKCITPITKYWMLWSLFCILICTHCTIYIVLPVYSRMKFHPFPRRSGTTRLGRWRVPGPRVKVDWLEPRGCCAFPKGCSPGLVDGTTASAPRPGRGNRILWTGCCALWPVRWMSTTGGRPLGESAAGFKQ